MSTTRAHCEITVGDSAPRFPGFGGISRLEPDSRLAGNRETGNSRFPTRPGPGIGVPPGGGGGPGPRLSWSGALADPRAGSSVAAWALPSRPCGRADVSVRRGAGRCPCQLGPGARVVEDSRMLRYMEADGLLPALRGCRVRPESAGFRGSTSGLRLSFGKSPFRRGYQ